ncbi:MAG: hypothetical protein U0165_00460 [Polyangiaceae bacterium]
MADSRGIGDALRGLLSVVPPWVQFARSYASLAHSVLPPRPPAESSPIHRALAMLVAARGHELDEVTITPGLDRYGGAPFTQVRFRARDREAELALTSEIWESLAPSSWLDDDTRCFADVDGRMATSPPSLKVALALLVDPARAITAEEIAREAHVRLSSWGAEPLRRLVWRVVDEDSLQTTANTNVWRNDWDDHDFDACRAARSAVRRPTDDMSSLSQVPRDLYSFFIRQPGPHQGQVGQYARVRASSLVEGAWWWSKAVELDLEITDVNRMRPGWPDVLGKRFSEVLNPFVPLISLHELGHPLMQARRGSLMLIAPLPTWLEDV